MDNNIRAGFAQVEYKPPIGLPLMGHLRDDYLSTGFHDPLYCKAVVFADSSNNKAALVSLDICMVNRSQVSLMRNYISKRTEIPEKDILIAATHTHGGPATEQLYIMPKASDNDIEKFLLLACEAVIKAEKNLVLCETKIGYASEDRISFNRRIKYRDGKVHMNWEPIDPQMVTGTEGPIDPEMSVLSFESDACKIALVNFALHPAILDYENQLYTADFSGYLSECLRAAYGENFGSLYFNGCCANINHIDWQDSFASRRGYGMAQRVGFIAGVCAMRGIRNSSPVNLNGIAVSNRYVTLKKYKLSEESYKNAKKYLKKLHRSVNSTDGLPTEFTAPVYMKMYESQHLDDKVEVMVMRLGEVAVMGLPGETFCEFGLEIKAKSPSKHTLVIELANDAVGYLPTGDAFEAGGYEVSPGATRYEKGAGETLVKSALNQLTELFIK